MSRKYKSRELPPLPRESKPPVKSPVQDGLAGFVIVCFFILKFVEYIIVDGHCITWTWLKTVLIFVVRCSFRMANFDACESELLVILIKKRNTHKLFIITSEAHTVCKFSLY